MQNEVNLKQGAWVWDRAWSLKFPQHWTVTVFSHKDVPILDETNITEKISAPIGSQALDKILNPGMKVLIICDDLSRPTPTDKLLPILIKTLEKKGIEKKHCSILIASGTHHPMNDDEIRLKLGKQVVDSYKVHRHDYRKKGVFMGSTTQGTPVYVNKQLKKHDLIIGLGGIYPHSNTGFSGGAKLILGVSSIRTILHFHLKRKGAATGGNTNNDFRQDVLDAARLSGMNFIVNSMINKEREITELVSGDVEKAFNHGLKLSRTIYGVPVPDSDHFDLLIADTYPFDASYAFTRKGWWPVRNSALDCYKLIISSMHDGKGGHLVYPIPNDPGINKLKRLYYELVAFGLAHFFTNTLVVRMNNIFTRLGIRRKKSGGRNHSPEHAQGPDSELPGGDVAILHHASGQARKTLQNLPNKLFETPEQYIRYIQEREGDKVMRVALYQASSLTFPDQEIS